MAAQLAGYQPSEVFEDRQERHRQGHPPGDLVTFPGDLVTRVGDLGPDVSELKAESSEFEMSDRS
jgi:hypothetical protein